MSDGYPEITVRPAPQWVSLSHATGMGPGSSPLHSFIAIDGETVDRTAPQQPSEGSVRWDHRLSRPVPELSRVTVTVFRGGELLGKGSVRGADLPCTVPLEGQGQVAFTSVSSPTLPRTASLQSPIYPDEVEQHSRPKETVAGVVEEEVVEPEDEGDGQELRSLQSKMRSLEEGFARRKQSSAAWEPPVLAEETAPVMEPSERRLGVGRVDREERKVKGGTIESLEITVE
eukprot:Sspe_Gene.21705::Locus_8158_Transcript_1_1_Confidence_1.000_Length_6219::g.21705::m.21705